MSALATDSKVHKRIFVFSHPRTRSNLLMRLLQTHPQIKQKQYPFMWAYMSGPDAQWPKERMNMRIKASGRPKEDFEQNVLSYQSGLDEMEQLFAKVNAET
ncbi:hypothetical protein GYMLUDRAFT_980661 [Collybiopsis luxurians FD-317 M1]|nr:hypothetical protein GYMLUDRAFT_980661 [Collybiopsis luxurians FD-317 M1]